jgi:hypothetical protein
MLGCPFNSLLIALTILSSAGVAYKSASLGIKFDLSTNARVLGSLLD